MNILTNFLNNLFHLTKDDKNELMELNNNLIETVNKDLKMHPIFKELELWTELKYKHLKVKNPIKNRMGQAYVKIFFNQLFNLVTDLATDYYLYISNSTELRNRITSAIHNIRTESLGCGIPELFLDKIEQINVTYFEIIIKLSDNICRSTFYSQDSEKMAAVFDILMFYTTLKSQDIEHTINQMNGELQIILEGSIFDK